jgi:hypothetical protein
MESNKRSVDSKQPQTNFSQQHGTPPPQPQQYDIGQPTGGEESAPINSIGLHHDDQSSNPNKQHNRLGTDSYMLLEVQARPPLSTAFVHDKPANTQVRSGRTYTQIHGTTTMECQPSRDNLEPSMEQAASRSKSSQSEPVPRNPQVKWWLELAKRKGAKGVEGTSPPNPDESLHPDGTQARDPRDPQVKW